MELGEKPLPALGKVPPEFFNRVIYPRLGADDPALIVKPQHGVDFGVVDLGAAGRGAAAHRAADLGDQVMVLSTDPFYFARELGIETAAWFAVPIIASDVAVSGIPPTRARPVRGIWR